MKRKRALTLIELLIASSIFLVVMLTVYSAFHTGIFGHRNIEKNIEVYQAARQILERINLDLRNSFAYSPDEAKFAGESNRLGFLTLVDSYHKDKLLEDYAFVSYRLEGNKLFRVCRKNTESLNEKSEVEPEEMASNVEKLIFDYGFMDPDTKTIEFKESWNDKKALPQSVRIKLSIDDRETGIKRDFARAIFLPLAE